jgi:hypothetical protein
MDATVLLRLDEPEDDIRPTDAIESLHDLAPVAPLVMPAVVDGFSGFAREFAGNGVGSRGLLALDRVSGTTLHQRDMTVQAIVRWDAVGQDAELSPGTIYARGKGGSVAEYCSGGIEIRVVSVPDLVGELRWIWHDGAGALKTQVGGYFKAPADGWLLLTATRRWISPTEVALAYYVGDQLLLELVSTDGSIGGGTTGTTQVGARWEGLGWSNFFAGAIDSLRVLPRELAAEEIAMTWRRITLYQPRGYELVKALHSPSFPISDDPASRVQKETRLWGHALGYGATSAELLREHLLPDRAYGAALEQWEGITRPLPPKQGDSIEIRRARVVARLRESQGVSLPGVRGVLDELVDMDPEDLEFLAFDQTTVDTFATLNELRWFYDPAAQWTIAANALRVQASGASPIRFDGGNRAWYTARQSIGGNGRGAHVLAKLTPTTLAIAAFVSTEVGVFLGNHIDGNFILFGLRHDAGGAYQLVSETFKAWSSEGVVVHAATALITMHLHLALDDGGVIGFSQNDTDFTAGMSSVGEAGPYTEFQRSTFGVTGYQWAGLYARSIGAAGAAIDVAFDDVKVRAPYGDRPFHFYVYRDPAIAGALDAAAANAILRDLKHDFTVGAVVTAKVALYDDDETTHDGPPMGGI